MKLAQINDWLTLAANLGVIVGILFLAAELSQTNELMESERRFNRLEISVNGNQAYFENPQLNEALRKDRAGEELTENEEISLNFQITNVFNIWQWTWIELHGTDEFPLAQYRNVMQQSDVLLRRWKSHKLRLMPEFVDFVEKNIIPR